jgi:hypothetical protein
MGSEPLGSKVHVYIGYIRINFIIAYQNKNHTFNWLNALHVTRQQDKQQTTKHYTLRSSNRTLLKTKGELRCSGRVSSSCSTRSFLFLWNPILNFILIQPITNFGLISWDLTDPVSTGSLYLCI